MGENQSVPPTHTAPVQEALNTKWDRVSAMVLRALLYVKSVEAMFPLKGEIFVWGIKKNQDQIKCCILWRSTFFRWWIDSDLYGSHSQSWSFDPKDHLRWAIGLLTLIHLCLNGQGLKISTTIPFHSVTSLFSGWTHQSNSHPLQIQYADGRLQESFSRKRSRVWAEEGGERQPNPLSGRVRWSLFVWCVFGILHLMRNLQSWGVVLWLPGFHWC